MSKDPRTAFQEIYERNLWKGSQSVSGPGSSLGATKLLRPALGALFSELDIRSLLDAPCGDAGWMAELIEQLDRYHGVDIVPAIIAENRARHAGSNKSTFEVADVIVDELPTADAALCRDCVVHLPLEAGVRALENLAKTGCRYLLATTFPSVTDNRDSAYGGWRPLNLTLAPFRLPNPSRLIAERAPDPRDKYNDKSVGVWSREQLGTVLGHST